MQTFASLPFVCPRRKEPSMALFKWDVFPPPDEPAALRWQQKDGSPTRWQLFAQTCKEGITTLVGTIEKPLDEDRYYIGHAPPSAKELAEEKRAFADGLHICYQYTLQCRAAYPPCESYEGLGKAKRVLVLRVRRQEKALLEKAQDRQRYVLQAMDALEDILVQEKLNSLDEAPA